MPKPLELSIIGPRAPRGLQTHFDALASPQGLDGLAPTRLI
jgi:hypothetical protein